MNTESMFIGFGALFLGVLLGMNIGSSSAEKSERRAMNEVRHTVAAMQDQISALDGQIAGLSEAASAGTAEREALAGKLDGAVADLSAQLGDISSSVSSSIADAGAAQAAAVDEKLASLSGAIETAAAASPSASASLAAIATAPAATSANDAPAADVEGFVAGETAVLLGGKAKVFVSGTDDAAGTVRVAVNGQDLAVLDQTGPVAFSADGENCVLSLDALTSGHAQMSAECTATVETATPALQASEAARASAAEPKGPGQTAWLLDGKVRVFISGIDAAAGTARVAVNGTDTAVLGGAHVVTFDADGTACTLNLAEITDGRVQLSATCN